MNEDLDFNTLLMASIQNEKDEPKPDLLDEPSPPPMPPLLCAPEAPKVAGALNLNANLDFGLEPAGGSDQCGPYLFAALSPSAPDWAAPTTSGINSYGPQLAGQTDTGHIDQPPAPTTRELKRKLMKEKDKQRSHGIRKKSRIDNPTVRTHGIKKYISSANPLFMDMQTGQARVASTGYVGLGVRKQKVKRAKRARMSGRLDSLKWKPCDPTSERSEYIGLFYDWNSHSYLNRGKRSGYQPPGCQDSPRSLK